MILGDKLQQKMDSVTFTQERMKRQLDDLQDKVQVGSSFHTERATTDGITQLSILF